MIEIKQRNKELFPSREDAEKLLAWANEQNPGLWSAHSQVVARAAETIAKECNLNCDKAYAFGLLHDIGRFEGVRDLHHIYAGYQLMLEKGFDANARICLTHSFPYQNLGAYSGNKYDCTDIELDLINSTLLNVIYNDYDKLIQLCDSFCTAKGVCLIDVRLLDVVRRYGFNDFTFKKWDAIFSLKNYFTQLCGKNIYDLFYDEIRTVSFC